jgi:hypothetical protein
LAGDQGLPDTARRGELGMTDRIYLSSMFQRIMAWPQLTLAPVRMLYNFELVPTACTDLVQAPPACSRVWELERWIAGLKGEDVIPPYEYKNRVSYPHEVKGGNRAGQKIRERYSQPAEDAQFGIVANVCESDHVLRKGAKVLLQYCSGYGFERVSVYGSSYRGRKLVKFIPCWRLTNFRPMWLPPEDREYAFWLGTREEIQAVAQVMEDVASRHRAAHPNRRGADETPT